MLKHLSNRLFRTKHVQNAFNRHRKLYFCTEGSQTDDRYDVIVSGGGMVGSTMAASLGHEPSFENKKILLLEGAAESKFTFKPTYSSRVVAVSPTTVELMKSIGAWEHIEQMRHQEVKRMQVWDSCSDSLITFNQKQFEENLAHIVENDVLSAAVSKQLKTLNNVEIKFNSKVKGYTLPAPDSSSETTGDSHLAQVHMEDGTTFSSKLLIGADGFRSLVRKSANIHTVEWGYGQNAVVAVLKLSEETENNTAWQRFLKTGPIAMLPLSSEYSCLIWSTTTEDAKTLLKLPVENFIDAVNNAFWSDGEKNPIVDYATQVFDGILTSVGLDGSSQQQLPPTAIDIEEGSRASFPLGLCHSSQYVKSRMALIGDAAHRVHPLGGQGVNLGFSDVASLRDQIVTAIEHGSDIGSLVHLVEYESQRQRHNVPVMATMDGLNRLYGTSWTPIVLARSLGLQATNALEPVKERFIKGATS